LAGPNYGRRLWFDTGIEMQMPNRHVGTLVGIWYLGNVWLVSSSIRAVSKKLVSSDFGRRVKGWVGENRRRIRWTAVVIVGSAILHLVAKYSITMLRMRK